MFRIVKVFNEGKEYYIIEEKKWYGWSTVQDHWVDDLGISTYDMKFSTQEKAEEYYKEHLSKTCYQVVKVFH